MLEACDQVEWELLEAHWQVDAKHAGLQSQSEEMELDDRLAKTVSLEAYTIKSSIACCQKQMGLGLRQCDHDHDGSGHARACANIYKHLLMGDLYDPQD